MSNFNPQALETAVVPLTVEAVLAPGCLHNEPIRPECCGMLHCLQKKVFAHTSMSSLAPGRKERVEDDGDGVVCATVCSICKLQGVQGVWERGDECFG